MITVNEAKSFQMPLPNFFVLNVICDHASFNIGQFGANNVFRCGAHALHNLTLIIEQKTFNMPLAIVFLLHVIYDDGLFNDKIN